jgi:predicted ATPase
MRERAPWWYARVASLSPDDPSNARLLEEAKHATQEQVKRQLATFLQEASRLRPLVLLFEDLHWADVSTIDMLAYLGGKFERMRLLIITTYRPAEIALAEHPFLQIKPDLLSRGRCRDVELRFLTRADIARYLVLEYPGHGFPEAFSQLMHDKTEGSPLFMVDLVRDLQDKGIIGEVEGRWQLTQSLKEIRLELPDSVKGMIERKIQHLSEDEHRLLVTASVQGFAFDSAVVARVLSIDEEEVEERLQALEADYRFVRLMEEAEFPDGTLTLRYRFVHILYQNELYGSLTRTKRVRLSRATVKVLEGFYGARVDEVASELASLSETAREFEKAVIYYERGAEYAAGVFAYRESTELAQRGLDLLRTLPESPQRNEKELELQMTLGSSATAIYGYASPEIGQTYRRIHELIDQVDASRQVILSTLGLHSFY